MFFSDAFIWHMQRKSRRIHRLCSQKKFRYPGLPGSSHDSYRNALDLNCRIYVVEATLENKCTVSVCVFKTTITQVMLSVLSLFILFPVVFHVALVYNYFYL